MAMKTPVTVSLLVLAVLPTFPAPIDAQVGGNSVYGQATAKARAEQVERANRTLARDDHPPSPTSTFVEADVLLNQKADAFVAVFGVSHEAETLAESGRKMDATLKSLA